MKQKIFMLLALVMTVMTASAKSVTYALSVDQNAHGTIAFTNATGDEITSAAEGATVTVTLTPDDGWYGEPVGEWNAVIAAARNRTSSTTDIEMLKDITLTPVEGQTNQWTFTMERAEAVISATYRKLLTNTDITIADIEDMTYTGSELKPTVVVKDGETELVEGTDYTVSCSDNANAGTATATITGIGNYAGEVMKDFTINRGKGLVIFSPYSYTKKYGDPDFTITPEVTGNGTLAYSSEHPEVATVQAKTGLVSIKKVGYARIWATLSPSENHTGDYDWFEVIIEPRPVDYEGGTVTQDENGYTVTLTEDEDNPNADPLPDDVDLAGLTYSRTLTAPGSTEGDATIDDQPANLFTVCVPFDPETSTAVKYYTLSSVSGETLNFSETTTIVANTPYLVAVMGNVNFIESCTDQDVASMTINSSTVDGYTFNGTFAGMTNAEAQGKYILQAGNKWGKVTAENTGAFIPPFRAFIEGPASGARLLAGSIGGDGNTTGIKYIHTQDSNGSEQWYDLNGRRIERPTQNGIYIHNGRKEVLK